MVCAAFSWSMYSMVLRDKTELDTLSSMLVSGVAVATAHIVQLTHIASALEFYTYVYFTLWLTGMNSGIHVIVLDS